MFIILNLIVNPTSLNGIPDPAPNSNKNLPTPHNKPAASQHTPATLPLQQPSEVPTLQPHHLCNLPLSLAAKTGSLPDVAQSVPNVAQSVPNVAQPMPNVAPPVRNVENIDLLYQSFGPSLPQSTAFGLNGQMSLGFGPAYSMAHNDPFSTNFDQDIYTSFLNQPRQSEAAYKG